MRASLVFPLAAAAAAAADFAAEAAALFSILAARFSEPELAADDRTLGRCMALSHVESFYCCEIYYVVQGGPETLYLVWFLWDWLSVWVFKLGHQNIYSFPYKSC